MGNLPSKHTLEAAERHNAGCPFYTLPPDVLGLIYNKLSTAKDRASFYHACRHTRVPQIRGQLEKACLFADISNTRNVLITTVGTKRVLEPLMHHPGTSLKTLYIHMPNWDLLQQLKEQRAEAKVLHKLLGTAQPQRPKALLASVQHVYLVAHASRGPPPCRILSSMCPHLTTLSGLDLRIRAPQDLKWLHTLAKERPSLTTVCVRTFLVLTRQTIHLPPQLTWQVSSLTLIHPTSVQDLAAPAFAHGVSGIMVCPALLQVRDPDASTSMLSLIHTFPHIKALKILEVPLQCHLPLPLLKAALDGWPQLHKLGVMVPSILYLLEGDFPAWLKAACELVEASTLPSLDISLDVRSQLTDALKNKKDHKRLALAMHALMCSCHAVVGGDNREGLKKVRMTLPMLDGTQSKEEGKRGHKGALRKLYHMPYSLF